MCHILFSMTIPLERYFRWIWMYLAVGRAVLVKNENNMFLELISSYNASTKCHSVTYLNDTSTELVYFNVLQHSVVTIRKKDASYELNSDHLCTHTLKTTHKITYWSSEGLRLQQLSLESICNRNTRYIWRGEATYALECLIPTTYFKIFGISCVWSRLRGSVEARATFTTTTAATAAATFRSTSPDTA